MDEECKETGEEKNGGEKKEGKKNVNELTGIEQVQ